MDSNRHNSFPTRVKSLTLHYIVHALTPKQLSRPLLGRSPQWFLLKVLGKTSALPQDEALNQICIC